LVFSDSGVTQDLTIQFPPAIRNEIAEWISAPDVVKCR
jgi:hypothetical protein